MSITWYKNGQVKDTTIYKYDSANYYPKVIYKKTFYENGILKKVELYDTNGTPNGIWTKYYDNGQLNIKQEFSNTVKMESLLGMHYFRNIVGNYLSYYKNGQLRFKLAFNNGRMIDGVFYEYYENGNKKQYGEIKDGLRDGEWVELYENSNLKSKGRYFSSSYKACGRLPYTAYYEYKTGAWEYYYIDQTLMAKGVYNNEIINILNGCAGGANVNSGALNKSWIFKDTNGADLKMKQFIKKSLLENKEILQTRVYRLKDFND